MRIVVYNFVLGVIALSSSLTSLSPVKAQSSSGGCDAGLCRSRQHGNHRPIQRPYVVAGYGFRPVGYDYRYGTAELLRAAAAANVDNAIARSQHAHAARLEMENGVRFLTTRQERKQINRQTRFGHLHARGQQVRAENAAVLVSLPPQPALPAVDRASGRVAWPLLLRTSYYAKARGPIDQVFHQRSLTGSINPDHFLPMRDWIKEIECELKANVAYYEMPDYLVAKRFLRNLIDEARINLPARDPATQLAANSVHQ